MSILLRTLGLLVCLTVLAHAQPQSSANDLADLITVYPLSQPAQTAPPGATINIAANVIARRPTDIPYTLVFHLMDARSHAVRRVENNLNWNFTGLPTTRWTGPITIVTPLQVPSVPDGTYEIQMSMHDPAGRATRLSTGRDVAERSGLTYAVGNVIVRAGAPSPSPLAPAPPDLTGYKLSFSDDFKSLSISDTATHNGAKWYTGVVQCCMTTTDQTNTAMVGVRDPANPFSLVTGQGLRIRLQKKANTWTSGVIATVDQSGVGFSQQYGYFEMSAKFPSGLNTWPAFWLLNTASKTTKADAGEIDIVEYVANPAFNNVIRTTLHDWSSQRTEQPWSGNVVTIPSDGQFHKYAMLWTAETMTFYYDDSVTFRTPTPSMMHQPYFLLVDLGIGSGYPTDATPSPNDMAIQYVRAYSLPGQ